MTMLGALRDLASEQDCYLCGCTTSRPVCAQCVIALPTLPAGLCPGCALPGAAGSTCGRCLSNPPHYDATIAAFAYADPLDQGLQAFKYHHALGLSRFLAALLDGAIDAADAATTAAARAAGHARQVDLIVPMPLSRDRLAERGFNQALELALPIATRRRIRLDTGVATRTHNTPPQAALPWKERARNIKGAFACKAAIDGLHIAVVDDVMTTGATLDELARVLKAAGAVRVTNWVVARTLPHASI